MVFKHLYHTWQDIDTRILKQIRKPAEKVEEFGINSYGFSILSDILIPGKHCFDFSSFMLNFYGYCTTFNEPEKSAVQSLRHLHEEYRKRNISLTKLGLLSTALGFSELMRPARFFLNSAISGYTSVTKEGVKYDPVFNALWAVDRHLRLPFLLAGSALLAKGCYDFYLGFREKDSQHYMVGQQFVEIGVGLLEAGFYSYFRDGDNPNLGKKQKTLHELARDGIHSIREKIYAGEPVPVPVNNYHCLEERLNLL